MDKEKKKTEEATDAKSVLSNLESLRTIASIAFQAHKEVEATLCNRSTTTKPPPEVVEAISQVRSHKVKLQEFLSPWTLTFLPMKKSRQCRRLLPPKQGLSSLDVQNAYRSRKARREFQEKREAAIRIQGRIRGNQARMNTFEDRQKAKAKRAAGIDDREMGSARRGP